jgi:hypothetical protein
MLGACRATRDETACVIASIASVIRTKTRAKHQIVTFQTNVVANTISCCLASRLVCLEVTLFRHFCKRSHNKTAVATGIAIRIWHKQATETTHIGNEITTR